MIILFLKGIIRRQNLNKFITNDLSHVSAMISSEQLESAKKSFVFWLKKLSCPDFSEIMIGKGFKVMVKVELQFAHIEKLRKRFIWG